MTQHCKRILIDTGEFSGLRQAFQGGDAKTEAVGNFLVRQVVLQVKKERNSFFDLGVLCELQTFIVRKA